MYILFRILMKTQVKLLLYGAERYAVLIIRNRFDTGRDFNEISDNGFLHDIA
jgi:hypothetical protein